MNYIVILRRLKQSLIQSKRYVPNGVITNTIDVYNNGSEKDYLRDTSKIVFDFVNSRLGN